MSHGNSSSPTAIRFLFENSVFLIVGAVLALIWANVDSASHKAFFETDLLQLVTGANHDEQAHSDESQTHESGNSSETESGTTSDAEHGDGQSGTHGFSLYFIINDLLMALFFAIAGKEVWESLLPGGALSNPRKAATPLLATLGGIIGPAGLYLLGALAFNEWAELGRGWAIPCATDIAFSYLIARIIFGHGHPAIAFLLLLAIADDAAGLIILAIFYPTGDLQLTWLVATVAAVAIGFVFRRMKVQSFWWYLLIPGSLSWLSFYMAGIHPALGLVPIIPTLPHAHTDLGIFAIKELDRHDPLNEFEHFFKYPVEIVLGLFGFMQRCGCILQRWYWDVAGLGWPVHWQATGNWPSNPFCREGSRSANPRGHGLQTYHHVGLHCWYRVHRGPVCFGRRISRWWRSTRLGENGSPVELWRGDPLHRCCQVTRDQTNTPRRRYDGIRMTLSMFRDSGFIALKPFVAAFR